MHGLQHLTQNKVPYRMQKLVAKHSSMQPDSCRPPTQPTCGIRSATFSFSNASYPLKAPLSRALRGFFPPDGRLARKQWSLPPLAPNTDMAACGARIKGGSTTTQHKQHGGFFNPYCYYQIGTSTSMGTSTSTRTSTTISSSSSKWTMDWLDLMHG